MSKSLPYRTGIVGCKIGEQHARAIAAGSSLDLVAVCDLNAETAAGVAQITATISGNPEPRCFTDYEKMLAEVRPEIIVIATPDIFHHPMTLAAIRTGVRGIYCEKPITVRRSDALEMVAACRRTGVALAIGHQRRTYTLFRKMRQLIETGVIGEIELIRGATSGSLLCDGTHAVDTALYLAGDPEVSWVVGQIFRGEPYSQEARLQKPFLYSGMRYGHVVEKGAVLMAELSNRIRIEVVTGELRDPRHPYHDIEVFGTQGRLRRAGDGDKSLLLVQDEAGGYRPIDPEHACDEAADRVRLFEIFAAWVAEGGPPGFTLGPENAMRGFEVLMAGYESARRHSRIRPPITSTGFPLEEMIELGEIE